MSTVWIENNQQGYHKVGPKYPPFICAEIGINHNGDISLAKELIQAAKDSGAMAVKFQKRNVDMAVPEDQKYKLRETPWGVMKYIDYKKRMEFNERQYNAIEKECKRLDMLWFASVWDTSSVEFMSKYKLPVYKIGSATLTDYDVLDRVIRKKTPVIMSTGMSTMAEIEEAVTFMLEAHSRLILCHSTSIYPCPEDKLNLKFLKTLARRWPNLVLGYSGHEAGIGITQTAVAFGASYIERHFTLSRTNKDGTPAFGSDQAASLEPHEFKQMAKDCYSMWLAQGDGIKVVYPEEEEKKKTLRVAVNA